MVQFSHSYMIDSQIKATISSRNSRYSSHYTRQNTHCYMIDSQIKAVLTTGIHIDSYMIDS